MYTGLDEKEVAAARRQFGDNSLTRRGRQSLWRQFLAGFGDPIIKILLVALAVNVVFLFRTADWYETAGIAAAVFLATAVSTLSEYGSETAFQKLQSEAAGISCRIKRKDGVHLLPIDEAVVGDIVLLQAGERVPADGILLSGSLTVDQAALTGEAAEVNKTPTEKESSIRDLLAANRLFRGTVVTDGNGVMLVERVGDGTFYGGLAQELQEETRESPLRLRLTQLAKVLSRIGYVAAGLVGLADLLHTFWIETGGSLQSTLSLITNPETLIASLLHAATLAITVVVVAVPEGLPMMITVVLSANMRRMLRDHVLVRRLFGIETAGNLNLLFTDKTGTLTQGRPSVFCAVTGDGKRYERRESLRRARGFWQWMELSCATNSDSVTADGVPVGGNATDRALLQYVLPLTGSAAAVKRTPFDSEKKYAAATLADGRVLVKGAPEKLLPACTRFVDADGQLRPFTAKHTVETQLKDMTENAMRVIALIATFGGSATPPFSDAALVALIGISDPVRRTAAAAVREMTRAGIQTVMITGDNRETAVAIAKAAGILPKAPPKDAVITASELALLTDGELKRRLSSLRVVARALPSDKSRLVRVAQEAGAVVGMTGDGINDAPALKKADVGFAMGSGTEVAKEAGDIVILNDDYASIVHAVLYGRTIFKSIRKFLVFQLTMNLCAVGMSVIGPFIGIDTPVTVMQMLWVNLIMDTLAGLAYAGEPPLAEYMHEPPKARSEPVLTRAMLLQILWCGGFTVLLCITFLKLPVFFGFFRPTAGETYFYSAFFALFIFCGIFNSFNARTERLNLLAHLSGNRAFLPVMLAAAGVQVLLIIYGGSLFRAAPLTLHEWRRVMALSLTVLPADLLRKLIFQKRGL